MKIPKVLAIAILVLFFAAGTAFAAPTPIPLPYAETLSAQKVSNWLRSLHFTPSPEAVADALFAYNIHRVLDTPIKQQIHNGGMLAFYADTVLKNNTFNILTPEFATQTKLMQMGCIYYSRSFSGDGYWQVIEPNRGDFHFEITDLIVDSAAAAGGEILMVIAPYSSWDQKLPGSGRTPIPCFALGEEGTVSPVKNLMDYKNFIATLQKHLNSYFPGQHTYEIDNEMDGGAHATYEGNGAGYAQLLMESRKSLGPGAKIINGGSIGFMSGDIKKEPKIVNFWSDFFGTGGGNSINALNIHYCNEVGFSNPSQCDNFDILEMTLNHFNELMAVSKAKGVLNDIKDIWLTEFPACPALSERQIAEWNIKKFAFAAARNVKKIFIDFGGDPGSPAMFEKAGSTYTAKLTFYAQKLMNYMLTGFTGCEELVRTQQYRFTVKGKPIYVLWGNNVLPLELLGCAVKVTDVFGTKTTIETGTNWTVSKIAPLQNQDTPIFVQP